MKRNVFWGLLGLVLIFNFIGCGGNDDPKVYTVTIGTLTNANGSTITVNPKSGVEGTEINLIITEDNTYRLKSGTLKYGTNVINEETLCFKLPAENIVITAEFESLFIGTWIGGDGNGNALKFIDGIFGFGPEINRYVFKGTWIPQNDNIVELTATNAHNGYTTSIIEEIIGEMPFSLKFICEIKSNTTINLISYMNNEFNHEELLQLK